MPEVGREGDQTVEEVRSGGRQEGGAARVALGATRGQSETEGRGFRRKEVVVCLGRSLSHARMPMNRGD